MAANLLESWARCAAGSPGASVVRLDDAAVAIFPDSPEREIYNNALLARGSDGDRATRAVETLERFYAAAGVSAYAVWVHESETTSLRLMEAHGYTIDTSTRAMAMSLDDIRRPRVEVDLKVDLVAGDWAQYLRMLALEGLPDGLLAGVAPDAFHVRLAMADGEPVAAALAFDHAGDCGIYNVGTLPHVRRHGLGTALTALEMYDAHARGCTTASLQATEMAERVYESLGFRDLGCFMEYVPA